nr:hypothetical protein [Tanacetum cinerariifolium]
ENELRQREQAANLSIYTAEPSRRFDYIYDDDEESTIPLNEIVTQIPPSIAITPILPIEDPEDSLIMRDEDLSTIPKKESVELLSLVLRTLFQSHVSPRIHPRVISQSDEDVPEDNFKIYSNHLFEFDDEYISSDVNPLFDEVLEDIESKASYDSNLDEPTLLVTPLSVSNEDECFDPGDDIELLLHRDPSTPKMSVVSILEGFDQPQPPQSPVIHQPPQELSIPEMEDLKQQYLDELKRLSNLEYHDEIKISKDDDEDYTFAITPDEPVSSTEDPDNSLSMGDEHLDTIPATESDEFIKSGVKNLIPIPSEPEGVPEHVCDVPSHDNSPPLNVSTDQIEDFSESNEKFSLIDDDSYSIDDIDYVEASPSDSELVSSEVMEIVYYEKYYEK